jgi:hypothetical protein
MTTPPRRADLLTPGDVFLFGLEFPNRIIIYSAGKVWLEKIKGKFAKGFAMG